MLPVYITALVAASAISGSTIDRARVVFDSEELGKSLDTRGCCNAVASRKVSRDIRRIIAAGKLPALDVDVVKEFSAQ